jgi:hypothetical protein
VVGVTVVWPLPGVNVMVFCEHKVHGFAVVVVAEFNDLIIGKQIPTNLYLLLLLL